MDVRASPRARYPRNPTTSTEVRLGWFPARAHAAVGAAPQAEVWAWEMKAKADVKWIGGQVTWSSDQKLAA
jgi:hypothetical protein